MAQKLITESDVKNALAIKDFRNISKEKIMEFVSLIPNMDKDVAISIIDQFPVYKEFATNTVLALKDMCDMALEKNEVSQRETIAAYRKILDDLGEILKEDDISAEERADITNNMMMIADKIALKDTENKNFILGLIKYGAPLAGAAMLIGAAILGVNLKGKDIPIIKK